MPKTKEEERAYHRQWRLTKTPDEKERRRLARNASRQRRAGLTDEQREAIRLRDREYKRRLAAERTPEQAKLARDRCWRTRIKRVGFTAEILAARLQEQAGCCAICKEPLAFDKQTHGDHCHKTVKPRGILCHHCNTGIGALKDSPALLRSAIEYLEHWEKLNAP
jgi:hypothetical protein